MLRSNSLGRQTIIILEDNISLVNNLTFHSFSLDKHFFTVSHGGGN
jgi:hypothetical protein